MVITKAKNDYEQRLEPVSSLMEQMFAPSEEVSEAHQLVPEAVWYRSLCYKTIESWSRSRRVVTKVTYGSKGFFDTPCGYFFVCLPYSSLQALHSEVLS